MIPGLLRSVKQDRTWTRTPSGSNAQSAFQGSDALRKPGPEPKVPEALPTPKGSWFGQGSAARSAARSPKRVPGVMPPKQGSGFCQVSFVQEPMKWAPVTAEEMGSCWYYKIYKKRSAALRSMSSRSWQEPISWAAQRPITCLF